MLKSLCLHCFKFETLPNIYSTVVSVYIGLIWLAGTAGWKNIYRAVMAPSRRLLQGQRPDPNSINSKKSILGKRVLRVYKNSFMVVTERWWTVFTEKKNTWVMQLFNNISTVLALLMWPAQRLMFSLGAINNFLFSLLQRSPAQIIPPQYL